tara:strand:+ start:11726 stop:12724 length:999 start_codon:yes stop_codon:yes gene_type:complete
MTKYSRILSFFVIGFIAISGEQVLAQTSYGEDRSGTEGFQFTKITVDARSAAMGNSNMADALDGSSLYWNPALASKIGTSFVNLSHTAYLVETSQQYFSYIHKYRDFAFGGSIQYFTSGDQNETTETQPFGTGRTFRTHHLAVTLTGSHKITDLFSYGISLKYYYLNIFDVTYQTGAIDFGFSYDVGDTGLRFGVSINNFGLESSPEGDVTNKTPNGQVTTKPQSNLSLPTRFIIAAAYDVYEDEQSKVVITGQINNPSDNSEQLNIGTEYSFMDQFFIRAGYEFGNKERILPSFGAGVKVPFSGKMLKADYGYTNFDRLGTIHRISLGFNL